MKSRKPSSACEIYLEMIRNPPIKTHQHCYEKINMPLLVITGEIFLQKECETIEHLDKKAIQNAEDACKKSLAEQNLFRREVTDSNTVPNFESPKPR